MRVGALSDDAKEKAAAIDGPRTRYIELDRAFTSDD
jgi:hypothetical protein